MNKSRTIKAIYDKQGAAFIGLTPHQRDIVLNCIGAGFEAGQQSRPDYEQPTLFDSDTSEKLTPQEATLKRIFDNMPPIPDDTDGQCEWMDKIDAMKREAVMA